MPIAGSILSVVLVHLSLSRLELEYYRKMGHYHFLPHLFQFIIQYCLLITFYGPQTADHEKFCEEGCVWRDAGHCRTAIGRSDELFYFYTPTETIQHWEERVV
jgi:hypothetical protein